MRPTTGLLIFLFVVVVHSTKVFFIFQNLEVTDWVKFGRFLSRLQTTKLDFKKLVVADDENWLPKLTLATPLMSSVTHLEFQKIPAASLETLIEKISSDSFCKISGKSSIPPFTLLA